LGKFFFSEQRFVTTAAVAHLRLHGGDETGEASKLKQIAKISSITLDMLGAGGMANCSSGSGHVIYEQFESMANCSSGFGFAFGSRTTS
jgi:hypothetical protein